VAVEVLQKNHLSQRAWADEAAEPQKEQPQQQVSEVVVVAGQQTQQLVQKVSEEAVVGQQIR
jgi:hypothetical protein